MKMPAKKYTCIVKTGPKKFVKYRLNDLIKFTTFLDLNWSDWRWFNVFDNRTRVQVANFTKKHRPAWRRIWWMVPTIDYIIKSFLTLLRGVIALYPLQPLIRYAGLRSARIACDLPSFQKNTGMQLSQQVKSANRRLGWKNLMVKVSNGSLKAKPILNAKTTGTPWNLT